jgi:beta-glucosidase
MDAFAGHPQFEGIAMRVALSILMIMNVAASLAAAQSTPTYKNPDASVDSRIADLLQRMTIEEKVAQLEGDDSLPSFVPVPGVFDGANINPQIAKAHLGNGIGTYAFVGDFAGEAGTPQEAARKRNLLQQWVLENTRLGIPVLFHGEALHGGVFRGATTFPEVVGLGSTWDPDLIHTMFDVVARESRAIGNVMVLAPVLDLSRDPRYGRDEEMYSEDPYLVASMGVAAITGLQGEGSVPDREHVMATAKHFVHGQPENGANVGPSDFSERTMREVFLYPFEQAVRVGHVAAVLASYNENEGGIPAHADSWLLKDVLRGEFGFQGPIVSDYFGVRELQTRHHVAADATSAGLLAFRSGVDMELPEAVGFPALIAAVRDGSLPAVQLDAAVARVLRVKFEAGLFDHPFVDEGKIALTVGTEPHTALSRRIADESIVLLKNDRNTLPLAPASIRTLAVIGPNADKQRIGGYSGAANNFITVLDGVRRRAGSGTNIVYAEGCRLTEPDISPQLNQIAPYQAPSAAHDAELIAAAVAVAKSADTVLLVLGGNEVLSRESFGEGNGGLPPSYGDSDSIELPGRQLELVRQIAALGKPTVAVLINGKAFAIEELVKLVPAIVEAWYPGQETGNAVADLLFGDVNPSGHLPVTIARNVGQIPVYYYKHPAARRGYVLDSNEPLFPFGFGLSYTTFEISKPTLDQAEISRTGSATVTVTVKNTGVRDGDDVIQLYVHHETSSVVQPVILLKDFQRVKVPAGKSAQVSFRIGAEKLAILDREMKRTVEPGMVEILVGDSSARTQAATLAVKP